MFCKNCGYEVEDGKVFCSSCGKEIQMVPDYNAFEDDLLREILEEETVENQHKDNRLNQEKAEERKQLKKQIQQENAKKKKYILLGAAGIVCVILILTVFIAIFINKSNKKKSYSYQMDQAEKYLEYDNFESAAEYLLNASNLKKDDLDSRLLLLDCYLNLGQNDSALVLCQEIIRIDSNNLEAYKTMIKLYDKNGDFDSIVKLSSDVKNPEVLKLFNDYIVTKPIISIDNDKNSDGEYEEPIVFSLNTVGDTEIYFTIDGSDPIEKGTKYKKPVEIEEPGKIVIKAVSKNSKGLYSEIAIEEVKVSFSIPTVSISPDGGDFSDNSEKVTIELKDDWEAYYTWDGSEPDPESSDAVQYTEPLDIPEGNNVLTVVVYNTKTKKASDPYCANFVYYPKKS